MHIFSLAAILSLNNKIEVNYGQRNAFDKFWTIWAENVGSITRYEHNVTIIIPAKSVYSFGKEGTRCQISSIIGTDLWLVRWNSKFAKATIPLIIKLQAYLPLLKTMTFDNRRLLSKFLPVW